MQLVVDEFGGVRLENREIFTEFAVHAPVGCALDEVGRALAVDAMGEIVDGHAWISAEAVTRLADAEGADGGWRSGFEAMREYARGKGWLRADGAIRAHIEYY